jgi:hypothetical protein
MRACAVGQTYRIKRSRPGPGWYDYWEIRLDCLMKCSLDRKKSGYDK